MKLVNRNELENRLEILFEKLGISEEDAEEIYAEIEDMPYLDAIKLANGDLKGEWRKIHSVCRHLAAERRKVCRNRSIPPT